MAKVIKKGDKGEHVKTLKRALMLVKPRAFFDVQCSDKFDDDDTLAFVKRFQKAHGLKVDGIVGPAMVAKMQEASLTSTPVGALKDLVKYFGQTQVDKAKEAQEAAEAPEETKKMKLQIVDGEEIEIDVKKSKKPDLAWE